MDRTPQLNGSGKKCFATAVGVQDFAAIVERQTVDNPVIGETARWVCDRRAQVSFARILHPFRFSRGDTLR
jgi:hypothetical protein